MNGNIDIRITESGSRVVIRNIEGIATAADKASLSVDTLKNALHFSSSTANLKSIISTLSQLKTELASMSGSASYFTSLKNAIDTLNNKSGTIQKIATALNSLNASAANLTQFSRVLTQIGTNAHTVDLVVNAINRLGTSLPILQQFKNELLSIVATTPQIQGLAAALRGLGSIKTELQALASGAKTLSKELENAAKYAQQTQQRLQSMGQSAKGSSISLWDLRNSLAGVAVYLVASQVREWLDAWQSAAGLFKIATESMEQMHIVQQKVTDAAKETRQDFTSTSELYARLQRASQDVGASQEQMIQFTKGVGTVLAIQHTSANQARGALIQLGQALGMQNIRAQEFRSMNENLYVVLQTVAKNMDGMGGSVNKLRQKMLAGTLSSKEFFNAFLKGLPGLQADFAKTSVTISQAFAVMETNFISFIGHMDDSIGFSDKFGKAVIALSENLQYLIPVVVGVGVALAGTFGPAVIGYAATAIKSFWRLLASNPATIFIAGLATIATYIISMSNSINVGTSSVINFEGKCISVRATIKDVFSVINSDIAKTMTEFGSALSSIFTQIRVGLAQIVLQADITNDALGLQNMGSGWERFFKELAFSWDLALAGLIGFTLQWGVIIRTLVLHTKDSFNSIFNSILEGFEWVADKIIDGANKLRTTFGKEPLQFRGDLSLFKLPVSKDFSKSLQSNLQEAMDMAFMDMETNGVYSWLDDVFTRSQKLAEENKKAQLKAQAELNIAPPATLATDGKEQKRILDHMRKQFEKIQNLVDPTGAALREQNEAVEFLSKNLSAIGVTEKERAYYSDLIKKHYKDMIDPVNAMIEANKKEIDLLRLDPELRARAIELEKQKEELRKKGISDENMQLDILKQQNAERAKIAQISSAKEQIYSATIGKDQRGLAEDTAIKEMMKDPQSKFGKSNARDYFMQQQPDLFEGTQEQMDAQMVRFEEMYRKIDAMRQLDVISEQTAAQMKQKVNAQENEMRFKNASTIFGNLATLSKSGNAKLAAIGKAAAISQATIDGVLAVQKALASAPPPMNYILAGSIGVATAANVAQIASTPTGFMTGGEFTVGGRGGADSQMVAFRATPGERVAVQTPQQYRKGDPNRESGSKQSDTPMNLRIVNVLDKKIVGDFLATDQGEKLVLNVIQRNATSVKSLVR